MRSFGYQLAGTCETLFPTFGDTRTAAGGGLAGDTLRCQLKPPLSGVAREVDKRRGKVVFDSGFDEPFSIVAGGSRDDDSFVLKWCLLPQFQIEGSLDVDLNSDDRKDDEGIRDLGGLAAFVGGASCSR